MRRAANEPAFAALMHDCGGWERLLDTYREGGDPGGPDGYEQVVNELRAKIAATERMTRLLSTRAGRDHAPVPTQHAIQASRSARL